MRQIPKGHALSWRINKLHYDLGISPETLAGFYGISTEKVKRMLEFRGKIKRAWESWDYAWSFIEEHDIMKMGGYRNYFRGRFHE